MLELLIAVVCLMLVVVTCVAYKRLRSSREAPASLDAIAPYVPGSEGGSLKLSKTKSRAQAIQEQRSQMFRERARFGAATTGGCTGSFESTTDLSLLTTMEKRRGLTSSEGTEADQDSLHAENSNKRSDTTSAPNSARAALMSPSSKTPLSVDIERGNSSHYGNTNGGGNGGSCGSSAKTRADSVGSGCNSGYTSARSINCDYSGSSQQGRMRGTSSFGTGGGSGGNSNAVPQRSSSIIVANVTV